MRITLFVLVSLGCLAAFGECRDRTFKPNLLGPVQELKKRVDAAKGSNLLMVIEIVIDVLSTCLPFENVTIPTALTRDPSFLKNLVVPLDLKDDITAYMKTSDFAAIHNHLWNDAEWIDLIKLFYDAGWDGATPSDPNSVYDYFKGIYAYYDCPLSIPDGPPASRTLQTNEQRPKPLRDGESPFDLIKILLPPAACFNMEFLLEILRKLGESKLLEVANLLLYTTRELNTDASVHLLWATITEPAKGTSFRGTRTMEPVKKLINHWDSQLKQNPLFQFIFQVLSELTGIDFGALNINVVSNLISFVEYVLWGTPFPVPT